MAPTLSIGSILLQQAAITASFHYNSVEIVESRPNAGVSIQLLSILFIGMNTAASMLLKACEISKSAGVEQY